jgi:hypothetical protein
MQIFAQRKPHPQLAIPPITGKVDPSEKEVFMPHANTSLRLVATATILFTFNGCVDLNSGEDLTKLADNAKIALPRLSNDVAATCVRQNTLVEDIPANERPSSVTPQDCKPYQEIAHHLAADQTVLTDYFEALGKLASNKPMSYDATISAALTSISYNTAISANTAKASTAAEKILQALSNAATKGYRRKQLGILIKDTDPAIQSLTQALKQVITVDYADLLKNEETKLDNFYQAPIAARGQNERLALVLVQRQYHQDQQALDNRRADIVSYGKVMDDIAALHTKLLQEANKNFNASQAAKEIQPLIAAIQNALSAIESRLI